MRKGVLLLDYMEKRGDAVQVGVSNAAAKFMTEWVHDFRMKLVGFYLEQ